ncbi:MAG: portal protein [Gemmatimonadales bacterium]|nr:MAG: portal protein [Gemmatimonadales bacterium]
MIAETPILEELGLILLGAVGCFALVRYLRVPSIVAYILAGLVLGPVLGLVEVSDAVHLISEVGIALLLFLVGLELSLKKIRDVGKVAVVAGLGQVVFTAAGGLAICFLLGFDLLQGIFIATALTFSSTVVVVKLLDQKDELDSVYGRIAVGIFLVQDLVVVVALTFLSGLGRQEGMEFGEILTNLGLAFGGMVVLLAAAAVAARWVLPELLRKVAASQETLLVCSLALCFLFVMGAEVMEISLEIGAFLAGISLAQLPYNDDLRRRVHPLMNFFIAVFFVSLGIQMEFGAVAQIWWPAVVLSLFVLIGNPFIFMLLIARMGYGERTSFLTSVTVAQISEFSFIFAALGLSAGIIGEEILSLIGIVGLVTIGTSAFMILYNHQLYAWLEGRWVLRMFGASEGASPMEEEVRHEGHILVVGMNAMGRAIARRLHDEGHEVLAIDLDLAKLEELPCDTLLGNVEYRAVLEEAQLDSARFLVSALRIEEVNRLLAYRAQQAGVPCAIHSFDPASTIDLNRLGVEYVIDSQDVGVDKIVRVMGEKGVFQR